ncbi:hypothetical protein FKM82_009792 [Ascaphus truei]
MYQVCCGLNLKTENRGKQKLQNTAFDKSHCNISRMHHAAPDNNAFISSLAEVEMERIWKRFTKPCCGVLHPGPELTAILVNGISRRIGVR